MLKPFRVRLTDNEHRMISASEWQNDIAQVEHVLCASGQEILHCVCGFDMWKSAESIRERRAKVSLMAFVLDRQCAVWIRHKMLASVFPLFCDSHQHSIHSSVGDEDEKGFCVEKIVLRVVHNPQQFPSLNDSVN